MSNIEIFCIIYFTALLIYLIWYYIMLYDICDLFSKEPDYKNENIVYANDNILHNDLVEISKCDLIERYNSYHTSVILKYKNKSPKTIKYLTCICKPLNAVDDYIPLKYGDDSISIKHTGPTATNKIDGGFRLNCNFDLNLTRKIEIISIEIEYMDKTKVLIDEVGINDVVIDELN